MTALQRAGAAAACVGLLLVWSGCPLAGDRWAAPTPAVRTTEEAAGNRGAVIVPGVGVGPLMLGIRLGRLANLVPPGWRGAMTDPGGIREDQFVRLEGCGRKVRELYWPTTPDPSYAARGIVLVYLAGTKVFLIELQSPDYRTSTGLAVGSQPSSVKREFAPLEAYALLHDNPPSQGGRDLIYWVNESKGIAFAFAYEGPTFGRRVWSVDVFKPGTRFLPGGCVQYPQRWKKLTPYAIRLGKNKPSRKQRRGEATPGGRAAR